MQRSKEVKGKQPEPKGKLLASSQPADVAAPPPTMSPAQQEERGLPGKQKGSRRFTSRMCEECQRRHKGHCGTERAVKSCLRRNPVQPAQSAQPAGPAPSQLPASEAQRQGVDVPKEQVTGRTLGIAAQLQALSRRPSDAGEAARAHAAAQAGQKPGLTGQHPKPKVALQAQQQPGQKDVQEQASKKQRTAGKQASWSTGETEDTWTDGAAANRVGPAVSAPANASEAKNTSKQKKATKGKEAKANGKQAKGQEAGSVKNIKEPTNAASASQNRGSKASKAKASAANHDSISSAPQQAASSRSKLSKGSGPSQKVPPSKLRKLTKAGNISTAKQASPVTARLIVIS